MGNRHLKAKSAGHEYRRYVPKTLRAFVGKNAWIKYFDQTIARIDANRTADELDAKHGALIRRLRTLSADEQAKLTAVGGLERAFNPDDSDTLLHFVDIAAREFDRVDPNAPPSEAFVKQLRITRPHDPAKAALQLFNSKRAIKKTRDEVQARTITLSEDGLREDRGLGWLLQFANSDHAAGVKRTRTYLQRFRDHLGRDVEAATVTQQHVVDWRDAMKAQGLTPVNIAQHVAKISALFSNAVSDGKLTANPFAGLKVRGKGKTSGQKKRAPTPKELNQFMTASKGQPSPFEIVARCLLYSGARSSEIAGLRVDDVREIEGVWCFDIHDKHRTLKRGAIRVVPIANAVLSGVRALTKDRLPSAPLFDGIPTQAAGPGHWWQGVASKIMIAVRGDDKTLTAHGLRHLWTNIADDNGVDEDVGCYVQGHSMGKTVRARIYKTRPAMKRLKAGIEKVAAVIGKTLKP